MASGSVRFDLADGTRVVVERSDLRRVYDALWTFAAMPGAVSTAALLLDEEGRRYPHDVELNGAQSAALKHALAHQSE